MDDDVAEVTGEFSAGLAGRVRRIANREEDVNISSVQAWPSTVPAGDVVKPLPVKDEIGKAGEISLRPLIIQTLCNEKR